MILPYFEATGLNILDSTPEAATFQVTSIGTSRTESFSLLFTINGAVQDEDEISLQIGGLKNPTNSTSPPGYKVKATAVSGSVGIEPVTGLNIDKATFTTYNVIADRIGANQVSVRLVSTGSGNVRCVAIPLDANKPYASL